MKKFLFAVAFAALALVGCKGGDDAPVYQLEGYQWISEEFDGAGGPNYRVLLDIGKCKSGQYALAHVMCEDLDPYTEGDIVRVIDGSYTYAASTGVLEMQYAGSATVSFINETTVKINLKGDIMVYTRSTKRYNLDDAIDPIIPQPEFTITPEKDGDWAGGTIKINATREVANWSYELVLSSNTNPEYISEVSTTCPTTISEDGEITLGMYWEQIGPKFYDLVNMTIKVTAETADGEIATCEVVSKAWDAQLNVCAHGNGDDAKIFNAAFSWRDRWNSYFENNDYMCINYLSNSDVAITDDSFLNNVEVECFDREGGAGATPVSVDGDEYRYIVSVSTSEGGEFKLRISYGAFSYEVGPFDVLVP